MRRNLTRGRGGAARHSMKLGGADLGGGRGGGPGDRKPPGPQGRNVGRGWRGRVLIGWRLATASDGGAGALGLPVRAAGAGRAASSSLQQLGGAPSRGSIVAAWPGGPGPAGGTPEVPGPRAGCRLLCLERQPRQARIDRGLAACAFGEG